MMSEFVIGRGGLLLTTGCDGMIILVHASVSKMDIFDPVIPSQIEVIQNHNREFGESRVRLRVAVHAGEVHRDPHGWAGADINTTCWLVNAEAAYRQLSDHAHEDVVLVISDVVHQSVSVTERASALSCPTAAARPTLSARGCFG